MTFIELDMWSSVLGINLPVNMLMPDSMYRKTPPRVLYLLHGLSDDESIWCRRTSLERYVGSENLCVVMPTTRRGFYTNMKNGYAYWTYISLELPRFVSGTFRVSGRREDTYAAGVSMGGYGAVKLGLRRSGCFRRIFSVSGALDMDAHRGILREFGNVFGDRVPEEDNVYSLLDKCAETGCVPPPIQLFCGTEDAFHDDNVRFARQAQSLGFSVTLEDAPAGHEWNYWDRTLETIIGRICED